MSPSEQQRLYVDAMYPSPRWKQKVSRMTDAQVYAIYMRTIQKEHEAKETKKKTDNDQDIPF